MRNSPPKDGDQWRINFSSVQWDVTWDKENKVYVKDPPDQSKNNWVWSPQWEVNMHKPELWGYVQFSSHTATLEGDQDKLVGPGSALKAGLDSHDDHAASAPVPEGAQAIPGSSSSSSSSRKWASVSSPSIPFVLDASWPIRTFLMEGYRLQKALFEKTGSYASSLDELGLPRLSPDQGYREVVQCTEVSFIVSAQMPIKASGATSSSGLTSTDGQDSYGDDAVVSISSTVAVSNSSQNNSMNRNDVTRYYVNEQGHIFWRTVSTA
ncbi:hypothetical protein CEUSTIGMA_g6717.t1 [Chlamydomonas eustigma]|uniref:Uncharacterized protein n=1 Tax=Chlamydomonas eustigma TaxID=1157962 RepID=A0A250X888_9CHLO|nr:hypothetical protein CEUSTIGMA_g6717.t1 [Chlamydomonas eustigma]|eukprot:GAX79277.1 hypothetical protein CEUSTIGMA_g6717.t1 [Chlamydomonas eustigma]